MVSNASLAKNIEEAEVPWSKIGNKAFFYAQECVRSSAAVRMDRRLVGSGPGPVASRLLPSMFVAKRIIYLNMVIFIKKFKSRFFWKHVFPRFVTLGIRKGKIKPLIQLVDEFYLCSLQDQFLVCKRYLIRFTGTLISRHYRYAPLPGLLRTM